MIKFLLVLQLLGPSAPILTQPLGLFNTAVECQTILHMYQRTNRDVVHFKYRCIIIREV
jgi:hypothetical protein